MFGSLGFTELILILVIVLIIFGAGKLPQLGEGLGKAIKGFKKSVHEAEAIEAEAQQIEAAQQAQAVIEMSELCLRQKGRPSTRAALFEEAVGRFPKVQVGVGRRLRRARTHRLQRRCFHERWPA